MKPKLTSKSRPLTHEERRKLIEAPISIRVHGSSMAWSGTGVVNMDNVFRPRTVTPGCRVPLASVVFE